MPAATDEEHPLGPALAGPATGVIICVLLSKRLQEDNGFFRARGTLPRIARPQTVYDNGELGGHVCPRLAQGRRRLNQQLLQTV